MGTASSKDKDKDTAGDAGGASPARYIKVPKPSAKPAAEEALPTVAPPADLLVEPTSVAALPTTLLDGPTTIPTAVADSDEADKPVDVLADPEAVAAIPTAVADSDEADKPTEGTAAPLRVKRPAPSAISSVGPSLPSRITNISSHVHRPAPRVGDDDYVAPVPYVPPPPRNVVEVEKRTPDAASLAISPANDGVEDAIASRYHLAVSMLKAGAPRADVVVATREYGPGACDVAHLCICSREGDCAVYEDGKYEQAPRRHKIPLAAGDEVVAGVYGGYGASSHAAGGWWLVAGGRLPACVACRRVWT